MMGFMESFARALAAVVEVMRAGAATHPDNDWVRRAPGYHIGRAEGHFFRKGGGPKRVLWCCRFWLCQMLTCWNS
jgi:hypothetical protein